MLRILYQWLLVGLLAPAYAQSTMDRAAQKATDSFLAALKIAEIPEGRKALHDGAWSSDARILQDRPIILDTKTLHDGMFDTDVPRVQGFRRLVEVKVQSQANTVLTTRYIVVSYKDRASGKWKVFDMRDLRGSSAEHEARAAGRDLNDTQYSKKQNNYRRYAYWLTFDGKIMEASKAYLTAIGINKEDPDPKWQDAEQDMAILRRMGAK